MAPKKPKKGSGGDVKLKLKKAAVKSGKVSETEEEPREERKEQEENAEIGTFYY